MARDLVCFSHLRWDFVYQRPNHLMARAARDRRVIFVEEPTFSGDAAPHVSTVVREQVLVVTPRLPEGMEAESTPVLARLLDHLLRNHEVRQPVLWYYTPMALPWSRHVASSAVIYDSMDHLAGFRGAPPELLSLEGELLERADLVFCGGVSLHGRMARRHPSTHCFPSSVDVAHFRTARADAAEPADLAPIPRPRIGYAGVIDERIDVELIGGVAKARPDWQIVLVGPIVKIAPEDVPSGPNIHRLGMKSYAELPSYLGGWDVGWMPFARNDATRYISPTKTPEYLAAGLPVVSTSITDVVDPYARQGLVRIADCVDSSVEMLERTLAEPATDQGRVDAFLAARSWDRTWAAMSELVDGLDAVVSAPRPEVARERIAVRLGGASSRAGLPSVAASAVRGNAPTAAAPNRASTLASALTASNASRTSGSSALTPMPSRSGRSGRGG